MLEANLNTAKQSLLRWLHAITTTNPPICEPVGDATEQRQKWRKGGNNVIIIIIIIIIKLLAICCMLGGSWKIT